ncbi:IclR family transcriptional regulator [Microbacterium pseudoresistens]|uniref:DNA-binding IclR family transcriptional regulator n=1 Tax=Microbacterium pseudoresistens TaxID=640634 RepID=A0A7Y9JLH2_9MICO|nr:IclR family transcriptional regulator [Microbacterium pseudoresistens]NYD53692.1 DNA-binding IclR family transcriptional regulator [Microbacterium pseudoresistens]
MTEPKNNSLVGVERTLSVLEAFLQRSSWGLSDLARHLELNKAVVYRIVRSLEQRGFVEQPEERGAYVLGPAAVALGRSVKNRSLATVARRHLVRTAESTGEVTLLYSLRGHRYLCVDRLDMNSATEVTVEVGDTVGLHAGAGRSILAFQDDRFVDEVLAAPLSRYTNRTPNDPKQIRELLAGIRRTGHCVSAGEITPETVGVSAPVRDDKGRVRYAVCISVDAPGDQVDPLRLDYLVGAVVDTAASISQSLGYQEEHPLEERL